MTLLSGPLASVVHAHGETLIALAFVGAGAVHLITMAAFLLIRGEKGDKMQVLGAYLTCLLLAGVLLLSAIGSTPGDAVMRWLTRIGHWIYFGIMLLGLPRRRTVNPSRKSRHKLVRGLHDTPFEVRMLTWHGTQGDTGSGEMGTLSGSQSTAHVVLSSGTACVWMCCRLAGSGTGCAIPADIANNPCP